jgi:hypothetical protein
MKNQDRRQSRVPSARSRELLALFESAPAHFHKDPLRIFLSQLPPRREFDCPGLTDFPVVWGRELPEVIQCTLAHFEATAWPELHHWKPGFSSPSLPPDEEPGFNLFEHLIELDQYDEKSTRLLEVFTGSVCIGTLRNEDRLMYGFYDADFGLEDSPIYLYDKHLRALTERPLARNMGCLAYLTCLSHAYFLQEVLPEYEFRRFFQRLRGQVNPTRHFADLFESAGLNPEDPDFGFEAPSQPTRILLKRSSWIIQLLRDGEFFNSGELEERMEPSMVRRMSDDQHERTLSVVTDHLPVALYVLFRTFFFADVRRQFEYTNVGLASKSRLIRDAALLLHKLHSGQNTLGTIRDLNRLLERFRERVRHFDLIVEQSASRASLDHLRFFPFSDTKSSYWRRFYPPSAHWYCLCNTDHRKERCTVMWDTVVIMDPQSRHEYEQEESRPDPPPIPDARVRKLHKRLANIDRRIDHLNRIVRGLENALQATTAIGPYELIHLPEGLGAPGGFNAANAIDQRCLRRLKSLWNKHGGDACQESVRILSQKLRRMRLYCRSEVEAATRKLIDQIQVLERVKDRLQQELLRARQDRIITEVSIVPLLV